MAESDYIQMKQAVEVAQRKHDQAQGSLDTLLKQLKEDFGCSSLEAAEKKLDVLHEETKIAQQDFDQAFRTFKNTWDGKI